MPQRAADVVEMLKADHRRIRRMLRQLQEGPVAQIRGQLVDDICQALTLHLMLEEEIFYPAFLALTRNTEPCREARAEHEEIQRLIAQIGEAGPQQESFLARVKVLSAVVGHHFNEEEKRDGSFARAVGAGMDLAALGAQMKTRKAGLRKTLLLLRGGCAVTRLAESRNA